MNNAVEVSNVEVVDGGKDFIIELKQKDGWKICGINENALLCNYSKERRYRQQDLRRKELEETFGFPDMYLDIPYIRPHLLFIKEGENIPTEINRGLENIEGNLLFNRYRYENYYKILQNFPVVKEAIKNKIEGMDPRIFKYSIGTLDISPQTDWSMAGDLDGDNYLKNPCDDFEFLKISTYEIVKGITYSSKISEEEVLEKLYNKYEIFTPNLDHASASSIKDIYEKALDSLDKFRSQTNREIQEKRIQYLRRVYEYVKRQEEELRRIKNDPEFMDKYFAEASMENPLGFSGTYENLEKLNTFLKDKIVATYQTYEHGDYSEYINEIGKYVGLEYLYQGKNFSSYDFNRAIKSIDGGVSFSQDTYAVDRIRDALKKAGYEIKGVGRSGFKSRNSFIVLLPKVKIKAHIIKYGGAINGRNVGGESVWYCGEVPIDVNDQNEREKVLRIIEEARREEKNEEIKEFVDEFKSKGDGIFAVMDTGGRGKYQSIPERFKVLASMRIADTQDYRQNRSHTYANAIIDTEAVKGKKSITIKVPDNMKGLVIGKGGSNIKRISEELGLFIKVI